MNVACIADKESAPDPEFVGNAVVDAIGGKPIYFGHVDVKKRADKQPSRTHTLMLPLNRRWPSALPSECLKGTSGSLSGNLKKRLASEMMWHRMLRRDRTGATFSSRGRALTMRMWSCRIELIPYAEDDFQSDSRGVSGHQRRIFVFEAPDR